MTAVHRGVAVAAVAVIGVAAGACSDESGLPDLEAVGPEDFPVGATVMVDAHGCSPTDVEVVAGETVVMEAAADDVEAESDDHRYFTGGLLAGETTEWMMVEVGEVAFECGGDAGTDVGTITVVAPEAEPTS